MKFIDFVNNWDIDLDNIQDCHDELMVFDYKNKDGIIETRHAYPRRLYCKRTQYYKTPHWLFECHDLDRDRTRIFVVENIVEFLEVE